MCLRGPYFLLRNGLRLPGQPVPLYWPPVPLCPLAGLGSPYFGGARQAAKPASTPDKSLVFLVVLDVQAGHETALGGRGWEDGHGRVVKKKKKQNMQIGFIYNKTCSHIHRHHF